MPAKYLIADPYSNKKRLLGTPSAQLKMQFTCLAAPTWSKEHESCTDSIQVSKVEDAQHVQINRTRTFW